MHKKILASGRYFSFRMSDLIALRLWISIASQLKTTALGASDDSILSLAFIATNSLPTASTSADLAANPAPLSDALARVEHAFGCTFNDVNVVLASRFGHDDEPDSSPHFARLAQLVLAAALQGARKAEHVDAILGLPEEQQAALMDMVERVLSEVSSYSCASGERSPFPLNASQSLSPQSPASVFCADGTKRARCDALSPTGATPAAKSVGGRGALPPSPPLIANLCSVAEDEADRLALQELNADLRNVAEGVLQHCDAFEQDAHEASLLPTSSGAGAVRRLRSRDSLAGTGDVLSLLQSRSIDCSPRDSSPPQLSADITALSKELDAVKAALKVSETSASSSRAAEAAAVESLARLREEANVLRPAAALKEKAEAAAERLKKRVEALSDAHECQARAEARNAELVARLLDLEHEAAQAKVFRKLLEEVRARNCSAEVRCYELEASLAESRSACALLRAAMPGAEDVGSLRVGAVPSENASDASDQHSGMPFSSSLCASSNFVSNQGDSVAISSDDDKTAFDPRLAEQLAVSQEYSDPLI